MASYTERAKDFFNGLDKDHLDLVEKFYDAETIFQDPIHVSHGVKETKAYYEHQYQNVESVRFEYVQSVESGGEVFLTWKMHLKSPALNSGKEMTVDGVSFFSFGGKEDKVIFQRDYFDMGEFVYERIPVLKTLISFIKKKMMP